MRFPSIQALRAIESFERHGTIWQVAEELNVTRSAVSHQLRTLESDLAFNLLVRAGTRVELTTRGRDYARDVRAALRTLSAAGARNSGEGVSGTLDISCPPGFAAGWLCSRIDEFCTLFPDISLSVRTPRRLNDVSAPSIDLFIAFGNTTHANLHCEPLTEISFTPLCSPVYLNRFSGFGEVSDLERATLLHFVDRSDWLTWLRSVGARDRIAHGGILFSDMTLALAAATSGQGVMLGDRLTCRSALDAGTLVAPFEHEIVLSSGYMLAIPNERIDKPSVVAFRAWIFDKLVSQEPSNGK